MKIKDVISVLETIAPPKYQESYDNSGLIVGNADATLTQALICLDSTEEVVEEAINRGCNLVIAHHPIVFGGLKKITGKNYVERTVIKAIKNNIAIYAIHTNLDSVHTGVSKKISAKIGLQNCQILSPRKGLLKKLSVLCPIEQANLLRSRLLEAGAGQSGDFAETSFNLLGVSTLSHDAAAQHGTLRIDTVFAAHLEGKIIAAIAAFATSAPISYELSALDNHYSKIGFGMIGELQQPQDPSAFLSYLKQTMQTNCIRHTRMLRKPVQKIAVCGGAGFSLLPDAIAQKADVFITADVKYHQFFDAENHLILADIGHYESEQFTIELLGELLTEKIPNFAPILTQINTNPVFYL